MIKGGVERSLAVIVHNPGAASIVEKPLPGAIIHEIPHLLEPPPIPPGFEVIRLRHELGIGAQTFLFGVFGHLRESKRLSTVLRTFHRARTGADIALLVAGEFASSDLARSLEPMLHSEGIRRVGYVPESGFWRHAAAVDACISLRYPTAGETSGIAIRLMGLGKPVILTAGCETSRFPDSASFRGDAGPAEGEKLAGKRVLLALYP